MRQSGWASQNNHELMTNQTSSSANALQMILPAFWHRLLLLLSFVFIPCGQASAAVLHYFKQEQGRDSVTLGEFAEALEKVLQGFKFNSAPADASAPVLEADLQQLAADAGTAFELTFFPRLRDEMRARLQQSPHLLRFRGLRNCVMQLTGARRWSARCQDLQEQIVAFLRNCLSAEPHPEPCALVVE